MSVEAVVRKDFLDGIRSRLLWVLMGFFALVLVGVAVLVTRGGPPETRNEAVTILVLLRGGVLLTVLVLVPLTGLVVSLKSITRERERGSIKVLLSLPHTRGEVLAGKFVGRSGLLTAAILAGFVPAGIVYVGRIDSFPIGQYAFFTIAAILLGFQFIAIGVAASALLETESQATVAGIGLFFVLLTWRRIFGFLNDSLDLVSGDARFFVERFHLLTVFDDMVSALTALREDLPSNATTAISRFDPEAETTVVDGAQVVADQPFYLQHWFAFVILALWIAVPLAIGYYRFEHADL